MSIEDFVRLQQQRFNLSYHVNYALTANQMVGGLRGKRVLEVGGSLPRGFVSEILGVRQWIAVEETKYWDEIEGTGQVSDTAPDCRNTLKQLTSQTPDTLGDYDVLSGKMEEYPLALESYFDVVFSIAAFEHIARLPEVLEKIYASLRPGGMLFSLFSPIWSAADGHHLPNIADATGKIHSFATSLIPPWGHLIMSHFQMLNFLSKTIDTDAARKIVYYVYNSPHINRFFAEDYYAFAVQSSLQIIRVEPVFPQAPPPALQQRLEFWHPRYKKFSGNGMLMVMCRP